MKKYLPAICFAMFSTFTSYCQTCDSLIRTYGNEHISSRLFKTQHGFLFTGRFGSSSGGDSAMYLTKVSDCGTKLWENYYALKNTFQYYYQTAADVSANGNLFAVISADSNVSDLNIHNQIRLIKINPQGQQQWLGIYANDFDNVPFSVCATNDGGAATGGWQGFWFTSPNSALITKFDNSGNTEWSKTYGKGLVSSIKQTNDDGYIFIRYYATKNQLHSYLCKTNKNGKLLWNIETPPFYHYKYFDNNTAWAVQVLPSANNDAYTVVRTQGAGFYPDTIFVTKYNLQGEMLWNKTYNYLSYQSAVSIQNADDNGYLLTGSYNVANDTFGVYALRLNENGDTLWTRKITTSFTTNDYPHIYTSGYDGYEIAADKYAFGGIKQTNTAAGIHFASLLIKEIINDENTFSLKNISEGNFLQLSVYPNPAVDFCTIKMNDETENAEIKITNVYGKIIKIIHAGNQKTISFDVKQFSKGMYFISIIDNGKMLAASKFEVQ